ncbi:MAG: uracil-DNA glycosylase [Thermoplasmata archaeon]|nr:uracil-DNA glycosylase [Thermoplasmata archaeon]
MESARNLAAAAPVAPSGAFEQLAREIEACRRCPLGSTRAHVVVYRGAAHPTVVFLGEAPGKAEDEQGLPFVGRSGRRLDAAIAQLGLPTSAFGILNVIKCRPPGNRLVAEAVRQCRPFLERQLALLEPRIVVTLGAAALKAMDPKSPPITEAAGTVRSGASARVFPLVHPAATFRSRRYAQRWEQDLARLRELLRTFELETL